MSQQSLVLLGLTLVLVACGPKGEPARPATTAAAPSDTSPPPPAPAPGRDTVATPAPVKPPAPAPAPRRAPPSETPAPHPAPAPSPAPAPQPAPPTAQAADPWHPAPRDTLDNDTYQGWKQFELNCSRCHGEYAVGSSFAPALVVSLKEGGTIPTKEMFITTVCAGRLDKGMPSWCALGLEMAKIEEIYLYVKGRADGKIAIGRPALRQP